VNQEYKSTGVLTTITVTMEKDSSNQFAHVRQCIIHHASVSEKEKLVSPTNETSWHSLLQAAQIRQYKPLLNAVTDTVNDIPKAVLYHATCRSRFTMKRDLDSIKSVTDDSCDEPPSKRRSIRGETSDVRVFEPICIFKGIICKSDSKYIKGSHTRERLRQCVELRADKKLRSFAQDRGDDKILAVTSRELVAAEAMYHPSCYKLYTKGIEKPDPDERDSTKWGKALEEDAYSSAEKGAYKELFLYIRNILFQHPCVVKLTYLTQKLATSMQEAGITDIKRSTKNHIHRQLECEFGSSLHFTTSSSSKILVFPSSLTVDDLATENHGLQEELKMLKSNHEEKMNTVLQAALYVNESLTDHEESHGMQWPPDPSNTDKDHVNLPDPLQLFLQVALTGEVGSASQRIEWLINSIGQDIIYGASRGKVKPPKHILLPFAIKSLTGNVEVIKILNRLGHGMSYSQMTEMDTALCLKKIARLPDVGVPHPESVQPYINTTVAYDNIDRREETLSGAGTSHRVNGIIIQPTVYGPHLPKGPEHNITKSKQRSLLDFIDDRHLPTYNAGEKVGPPVRPRLQEVDYTDITKAAWRKTFVWFLCRLHSARNQNIPSWTGFNIKVSDADNAVPDNLGYLPTINAPATNMSTVLEILTQCTQIIHELKLGKLVCVFDQALYVKATEIKWKLSDKFDDVIIRMGAFHTTCTLLAIIGKRFQDAGLKDICIEAGIIAEGSIGSVLDGRMYNRAVRVHKLMYEALLRIAWKEFIPWVENNHPDKVPLLQEATALTGDLNDDICPLSYENVVTHADFGALFALFDRFLECLRTERGDLAAFWMSYIDIVALLLELIRSSRERNWTMHLASIRSLIPWCFAYDRLNYAKCLPVYYSDMTNLMFDDPEVYAYLERGGFAVHVGSSCNPFGSIPIDQAVEETVNKDTETPGGTKGFSLNPAALKKHYMTAEYRALFLGNLRDMLDMNAYQASSHPDLNKPRIAKDEKDIQAMEDLLKNNWINPFNPDISDIMSISTGLVPSKDIIQDLQNALDKGEKAYQNFKQTRLESSAVKYTDRLPKLKLKTFGDITKRAKQIKIDGKEAMLRADRNLFGNMIISAQSRNLDMREVLSHPLGPLPWSLATPDGCLRKTNKSALGRELEKSVPPAENIPTPNACIIDGMALVNKIQGDKKSFQEISDAMLSLVLAAGYDSRRIDVVFDVYRDISIKNAERASRASLGEALTYKHISAGTKVVQWRSFLRNSSNKMELISFLVSQWKEERCRRKMAERSKIVYVTSGEKCFKITGEGFDEVAELFSTQEEADTRMFLHAVHIARYAYQAIIILSMDTDVRLLCLAFCSHVSTPLFQKCGTDNRTRYIDICKMAQALGDDVCKALPSLHAFTGCDSISSFAGKGKLSALKLVKASPLYQEVFQELGSDWEIPPELFEKIEAFTCKLYSAKDGVGDINELRYQLFCARKGEIESFQLPPCADSLMKKAQRTCYQAAVWKRSLQADPQCPSPVGKGWIMETQDGVEILSPDWMDGQPAPVAVLQLLACKCRKLCQAPTCQCLTNGLHCTDMCKHNVNTCQNKPPEEDEIVSDAEGDEEDSDF
jgi:hypothetical protein